LSSLIVKVCKIDKILKHDNADRLEIATVGGWQCIILKDRYKKGDKIVYVPIDSMIPFELSEKLGITKYLENPERDKEGNIIFSRVRTVKLRGVISQGLILDADQSWEIDQNVKDIFGIKKYIPIFRHSNRSNKKHSMPGWRLPEYPDFNKYTDIENINHYINVFETGEEVIATEKLHGTNGRYGKLIIDPIYFPFMDRMKIYFKKTANKLTFGLYNYNPYMFLAGSHNCNIKRPGKWEQKHRDIIDVYWKIAEKYDLENKLRNGEEMFGEIYGVGIQKYFEYDALDEPKCRFFDLKFKQSLDAGMIYANWDIFESRCTVLDLPMVPILYRGPFYPELINEYKSGPSMIGNHMREGCVIKPVIERFHTKLGRIILKCISEEYLLFKGKKENELVKQGEESPELDIFDH